MSNYNDMLDMLFQYDSMDIHKQCEKIEAYVKQLESKSMDLQDKILSFDEDKRIKELKDEIADLRHQLYDNSLYPMTDVEKQREKDFRNRHYDSCKNGNRFIYELIGDGLGTTVKIKCPKCGAEEDITEGNW